MIKNKTLIIVFGGLLVFIAGTLVAQTTVVTSFIAPLVGSLGGTGVNNGSNTITLGGNLVTGGAFTTTLTTTATTNSTLPAGTHSLVSLDGAGQALTGGFHISSVSLGTKSSGTLTIDCGTGPLQFYTNGGAHTFAAPSNDSDCLVDTINNGSAGTITFSGFTVGTSTGDLLDTINAHGFTISIWRINGVSSYRIASHQ